MEATENTDHQREMLTEASILLEESAARVEALCKWAGFPLDGLPQWNNYDNAWGPLQSVINYWKSDE